MVLSVMGGAVGHAPGELALVRGHLYLWRRFACNSSVRRGQALLNTPSFGQSRKRISRHVAGSTRVINVGRRKQALAAMPIMAN